MREVVKETTLFFDEHVAMLALLAHCFLHILTAQYENDDDLPFVESNDGTCSRL